MLDIKFIRENPDIVKENIKKKFQDEKLPLVDEVIELDSQRRANIQEADPLRSDRNRLSKQVGMLMGQAKKDPSKLEEAEKIKLSAVFNAADGFCENREKCFPLAAERREHADRPYEQRHGEIRQHIEKPMPQSREKSYLHIRVPTVILRSTCRTAQRTHATIIAANRQKYAHEKPTDGRPASSEKP